jgi:hypothetical protein
VHDISVGGAGASRVKFRLLVQVNGQIIRVCDDKIEIETLARVAHVNALHK